MRRALLEWGLPEQIKTDNGKDYTSFHVTRVAADLGIEHELCPPFQPWHKPHVERFFKTFSHDVVPLLPGFIGHNVAERSELESRNAFAERLFKRGAEISGSYTAEEFQSVCDRWLEGYHARQHEGLGGRSPNQVYGEAGWVKREVSDVRALDYLLAEAPSGKGIRRVNKKGIKLDRAEYIAAELALWVGESVRVLYDPFDYGRVIVRSLEGEFICIAEAPEYTGISRQEVAAEATRLQRRQISEQTRELKAKARKVTTTDAAETILAARVEADRVTPFERRETVTTEGLEAAASAREAVDRTKFAQENPDWEAIRERNQRILAEQEEQERQREAALAKQRKEENYERDFMTLIVEIWRRGEEPAAKDVAELDRLLALTGMAKGKVESGLTQALGMDRAKDEYWPFRRWVKGLPRTELTVVESPNKEALGETRAGG